MNYPIRPLALGILLALLTPFAKAQTETVISTYHVRAGQEAAFVAAIKRTWEVYRKLDAVQPAPHLLMRRAAEDGKIDYIEIFSWRSGDIPDHAPAEIKAAWKELEVLCQLPNGKSGIDADEVSLVSG